MIIVVVKEIVEYPQQDQDFAFKTGLGTLLFFPGMLLVLPVFLACGFLYRVVIFTLKGKDELPDYDQVVPLFMQGLTSFVVWLVYLLPAAVLGAVALIPGMARHGGTLFSPQNILSNFLWFGSFVLALSGLFFIPMALARFAETGKLAAAFDFKGILTHIKSCAKDYPMLIAFIAGSVVALGFLGQFLAGAIPFYLGNLLSFGLVFYVGMVAMRWTGVLYRKHFPSSVPEPAQLSASAEVIESEPS